MDIFAKRLEYLRTKKGFTKKEMSEKLGVSQTYYGKFEKGTGQPNLEALAKLPEIFGESTDFLLGVVHYDRETKRLIDRLNAIITECRNTLERLSAGSEMIEKTEDPVKRQMAEQQFEFLVKRIKDLENKGRETLYTYQEKCKEIPFSVPLKFEYDFPENKEGL